MTERIPSPAARGRTRLGFGRRARRAPVRTAIGYLRTDLAGTDRIRWEPRIRAAAKAIGYDLLGTLIFPTAPPLERLRVLATELGVDAVLCPSFAHLDDRVPADLLTVTDLIVLDPPITYCRWDPRILP
ncbi:hypothetical protein ACWEVD_30170 [Nocardia thailandica]